MHTSFLRWRNKCVNSKFENFLLEGKVLCGLVWQKIDTLTGLKLGTFSPRLPGYKLLFTHQSIYRVKAINVTYFSPPRQIGYHSHSQSTRWKRRCIFGDQKLKKLALSDGIRLRPGKLSRLDFFKFWNAFTTQSIIPFSYITPHWILTSSLNFRDSVALLANIQAI